MSEHGVRGEEGRTLTHTSDSPSGMQMEPYKKDWCINSVYKIFFIEHFGHSIEGNDFDIFIISYIIHFDFI